MRALALLLVVLVACGGDDDGGPPIDAPAPDAPVDAPPPDAPPDAPVAPPMVTITSHAGGERITGSRTVTIAGDLVAEGTVDSVTVTVGAAAPIDATFTQSSFTASIALGDLDNPITVTATDTAEQSGSASLTLTYPFLTLGNFQPATLVLGQPDFFTRTLRAANDAGRFYLPEGHPADHGGVLYVPDGRDNRVLGFRGFPSESGQRADFALGQPNLTSTLSGARADRLSFPTAAAVHQGALFVTDYGNNRVVIWSSAPTRNAAPADRVLGQPDLTTSAPASCTATGLSGPLALAIAGGRLIVADSFNRRVLIWNTIPAADSVPPDVVLGQGDFTHCTINDDNQDGTRDAAPSARTMGAPFGVWSDGQRLFVTDATNHRVLIWNTFPTASFQPADAVLGQPSFTSAVLGTGATGFRSPGQITSNGNQLFVADGDGSRVLVWNALPSANTPAHVVLGQGDFTHYAQNDDDQNGMIDTTPTARTLALAHGVAWVRDRLWVTDTNNHRYLMFGPPLCPIDSDQFEYPAGSGTCVADPCATTTCTGFEACDRSTGAAQCVCPDGFTGAACDACVRYVDAAAVGIDDGFTWANAATTLQAGADAAFDAAMACDVWVKEGTYYTYRTASTNTVSLRGPVTVRGGFAGNETSAAARSGGATIVDGHEGPGEVFAVHHVVSATTSTPGTPAIDRLTIRGGNADSTATTRYGGGVLVGAGSRLAITDCNIEVNSASIGGGGLAALATASTAVTVSGTRFFANFAGEGGGGAFVRAGTISDSVFDGNAAAGIGFAQGGGGMLMTGTGTATRNRFVRNFAGGVGGALFVFGPSAAWTISDSELVGNRANGDGSAAYFDEFGSGSTLTRSVVAGNYASGTGTIFIFESATALRNLTIVGNVAGSVPGIVHSDSSASLVNSIVYDNVGGSSSQIGGTGTFTATYSDIEGGFAGTGNLDVAPQFVHAPLAWEAIVNQSAADTVVLRSSAGFAVGDHIEIGDDGVLRQITGIDVNALIFTPVLVTSLLPATVENWGTETANLVADFHLAASSPLIDAGTPAGTDLGRYP